MDGIRLENGKIIENWHRLALALATGIGELARRSKQERTPVFLDTGSHFLRRKKYANMKREHPLHFFLVFKLFKKMNQVSHRL